MENKKQIIINFFAGPSSGKSSATYQLFSYLKWHGINCEVASEYAKELVWEGSLDKLKNQIGVFGEQYDRVFRLIGKVDVIITDSPLPLSIVYDNLKYPSFKNLVLEIYNDFDNYNVFLNRKKKYNTKGRTQTEEEAIIKDQEIKDLLLSNNIKFIEIDGTKDDIKKLSKKILELL